MPAGDILLDASGNRILDASGNVFLSNGGTNSCCCVTCTCDYPADFGGSPVPQTIRVTFSGITSYGCVNMPTSSAATPSHNWVSGVVDGTYDLVHACAEGGFPTWLLNDKGNRFTWNGCMYYYRETGSDVTVNRYTAFPYCTGTPTVINEIRITLETRGNLHVYAPDFNNGFLNSGAHHFFNRTIGNSSGTGWSRGPFPYTTPTNSLTCTTPTNSVASGGTASIQPL